MPVKVLVGEVKAGVIVPCGPVALADGQRVTVFAEVPEIGLVAVDPEDAELIRILHETARRERPPAHSSLIAEVRRGAASACAAETSCTNSAR
jgi:hypothetical protein